MMRTVISGTSNFGYPMKTVSQFGIGAGNMGRTSDETVSVAGINLLRVTTKPRATV